jgi:hypothetical protein
LTRRIFIRYELIKAVIVEPETTAAPSGRLRPLPGLLTACLPVERAERRLVQRLGGRRHRIRPVARLAGPEPATIERPFQHGTIL